MFEIESTGTIGFHTGAPPDRRMQAAMRARGIPIIGHARQLQTNDRHTYDYNLAMDHENLLDTKRLEDDESVHVKIQLFSADCSNHDVDEIPDPYSGGSRGFEDVLDLVEDGCRGLQQRLSSN